MSTVDASLGETRRQCDNHARIASPSLLRAKALRRRREADGYSTILQKIVARWLEKPEARAQ
jgi:hypothetical protein